MIDLLLYHGANECLIGKGIKTSMLGTAAFFGNPMMVEHMLNQAYLQTHLETKVQKTHCDQISEYNTLEKIEGATPLMLAICTPKKASSLQCIKMLVNKGANVFCNDNNRSNILHYAAYYKRFHILLYLM